jgi:hypothetical protein
MFRNAPDPFILFAELALTILIAFICFAIFSKTGNAFRLTKHKGINYFRTAFLYIGFAYLLRLFPAMFMLTNIITDSFSPRHMMSPVFMILAGYISTMAIISLFMSTCWKKINWKYADMFSPVAAIAISAVSFISREPLIMVLCQTVLLILTAIMSIELHQKSAKFSRLTAIYILLVLFWVAGLMPLSSTHLIPHEFMFVTEFLSAVLFAVIFVKVSKWTK